VKRANGKSHCPVNFGLEVFGDPWSLLVVRDIVYWGKHSFNDFLASAEAIAPSVLSARLAHLEATGVLTRTPDPDDRRKMRYHLTETGLRLIPVLLEIAQWSAGVDSDTDAPAAWIETVAADKPAMVELITTTVRAGGSVFAGPDSVVARLHGTG
jgi:DNA-binding HxlR family transcriptional regulator